MGCYKMNFKYYILLIKKILYPYIVPIFRFATALYLSSRFLISHKRSSHSVLLVALSYEFESVLIYFFFTGSQIALS